jgi:hypothetical protein
MATANHQLQQQRPIIEARIKQLVNNDLKEICRAHNYQVSGNKANLQVRCIESEWYWSRLDGEGDAVDEDGERNPWLTKM